MDLYSPLHNNFKQKPGYFDLFTLALLFFIWGFLTQLNDILVPHLYEFGLSISEALMLHFTFFTTYLLFSYPAAKLIDRYGYKSGILIGLMVACLGCIVFYFGVGQYSYVWLLSALFIMGVGVTILQIAGNGYIVLQSTPRKAASNLTFAQAFNSLGRVITLFYSGYLIFWLTDITAEDLATLAPKEYLDAEAIIIKTPYLLLAAIILITAVLIYASKLPELNTKGLPMLTKDKGYEIDNILKVKHLLLASIAIFAYVGAEVSIGTYMYQYLALDVKGGQLFNEVKITELIQYYWGSAMVGRIIGGFIMRDLSPRKVIAAFAGAAAVFTAISILSEGNISVVAIVAVGFFNSILFPAIFTMGINGLGHFAEEGASVLIASIVGGAIVPLMVITLSDYVGLSYSYFIPVVCYLYIIYFGMYGSKFEKTSAA